MAANWTSFGRLGITRPEPCSKVTIPAMQSTLELEKA